MAPAAPLMMLKVGSQVAEPEAPVAGPAKPVLVLVRELKTVGVTAPPETGRSVGSSTTKVRVIGGLCW